jgi:hypothetical protein
MHFVTDRDFAFSIMGNIIHPRESHVKGKLYANRLIYGKYVAIISRLREVTGKMMKEISRKDQKYGFYIAKMAIIIGEWVYGNRRPQTQGGKHRRRQAG